MLNLLQIYYKMSMLILFSQRIHLIYRGTFVVPEKWLGTTDLRVIIVPSFSLRIVLISFLLSTHVFFQLKVKLGYKCLGEETLFFEEDPLLFKFYQMLLRTFFIILRKLWPPMHTPSFPPLNCNVVQIFANTTTKQPLPTFSNYFFGQTKTPKSMFLCLSCCNNAKNYFYLELEYFLGGQHWILLELTAILTQDSNYNFSQTKHW